MANAAHVLPHPCKIANIAMMEGNPWQNKYHKIRTLGQGAYGQVYLTKKETELFAIKEIKFDNERRFALAQNEYKHMCSLLEQSAINAPYVQIIEVYIEKARYSSDISGSVYIVMECAEGSLRQYMSNVLTVVDNDFEGQKDVRRIVMLLLEMVKYIHDRKLVHGDLKEDNILYFNDGQRFVLSDFGLSCLLSECNISAGTANYMDPSLFSKGKINDKTDMFSVGVIMFNLYAPGFKLTRRKRNSTSQTPTTIYLNFMALNTKEHLDYYEERMLFLKKKMRNPVPIDVYDVISNLLDPLNSSTRYSAQEALNILKGAQGVSAAPRITQWVQPVTNNEQNITFVKLLRDNIKDVIAEIAENESKSINQSTFLEEIKIHPNPIFKQFPNSFVNKHAKQVLAEFNENNSNKSSKNTVHLSF